MENKFDLIIIGAGPAGYVAAIKAARSGMKPALIEKDKVGGTCLNRGCIPAKAMLHASDLYREIQESGLFGISTKDAAFDYGSILRYKEETSENLVAGIKQLLKANGVVLVEGRGRLKKGRIVEVTDAEGKKDQYEGKNVLLASGSRPFVPDVEGSDLEGVLTSDGLFALEKLPESLVIIGGGVIGVEFAQAFSGLGCRVTVVEALDRLLPGMDREISQSLRLIMKKRGIELHTSSQVRKIEKEGSLLTCSIVEKGKEGTVSGQYVLWAVGRIPDTEDLFDEGLDIKFEKGRIVTDDRFMTGEEGVYAAGDITVGLQLAHRASAQAAAAVAFMNGREPETDLDVIPSCIYTDPEIASVGISADEAKQRGIETDTGKFIMSANGRSLISKEERGFIKVVTERKTGRVLGAQMMCARATDMIEEIGTALANGMTAAQLKKTVRPHPTYNEGLGEAIEDIWGEAVHKAPGKRR